MSILDPYLLAATQLNIDLTAPLDKPAAVFVLQKADSLGLVLYKQGMETDWLTAARLWDHKHGGKLTGQDLLAGALHLTTEPPQQRFLTPHTLFMAVGDYRRSQLKKALGHRQLPELPPELDGASLTDELAYTRHWRQAAITTGDYEHATAIARTKIGLPALPHTPKQPT